MPNLTSNDPLGWPEHRPYRSANGLSVVLDPSIPQRLRAPCGSPRCRRRVFRFANLSALPPCTHPRVARRRCHTARGLPPPVGLLDPTGVTARPAAIRGLLL